MARPVQVLIVDDEVDFLDSLGFWLQSKGYRVSKVRSGDKAVEIVREGKQDVVFLDIIMPGMDGIEALRRIRAFNKTIPVILVTAATQDENAIAGARALGIAGVFAKRGLAELTDVLEGALKTLPQPAAGAPTASPGGTSSLSEVAAWLRRLRQRLTPGGQ